MNKFSDLGLTGPVLKALANAGYDTPTPIQTKAIPIAVAGSDILGIAQTGTGKTAAFALPSLQRLATVRQAAPRKGCRVLVLSPTRELASQIAESFRLYAGNTRLSVMTVFGGVSHGPQIRALSRGVDVLVATPGRLLDHLAAGAVKLDQTEILILDEADQMLDLGFVRPIRSIVSRLPRDRQTMLFSATMPAAISELAQDFLRDPEHVSVTPVAATADRVNQRVCHVEAGDKRGFVAKLIRDQHMQRTIVFTRTKRGADKVAKFLDGAGIGASAIHGNKSQNQRERTLEGFRNGKIDVLVATDIAARGIDIDNVTHVINFELPEVAEAYVHRIGRTARAGASGSAISLCDRSEIKYLRAIERLIRQSIPAEHHARAKDETTATTDMPEDARRPERTSGRPPRKQDGNAQRKRQSSSRRGKTNPDDRGGELRNGQPHKPKRRNRSRAQKEHRPQVAAG